MPNIKLNSFIVMLEKTVDAKAYFEFGFSVNCSGLLWVELRVDDR